MEERTKKRLIFVSGLCGCCLIGLICLLMGLSFYVLGPLFYGLEFHETTQSLEADTLYKSGRHYIGLGYTLKEFPRFQLGLQFSTGLKGNDEAIRRYSDNVKYYSSVEARTKESIKITIDFAVQYSLTTHLANNDSQRAKQLHEIYSNFGMDWYPMLRLLSRAALLDVCSEFEFNSMITDRAEVGERLRARLREKFEFYHFTMEYAVLLNITFPSSLQSAISVTEQTKQNIEKAVFFKETKQIEANTNGLLRDIDRRKTVDVWSTNEKRVAEIFPARTINEQLWADKFYEAYNEAKTTFAWDNAAEANNRLLTYLWIRDITGSSQHKTHINAEYPHYLKNYLLPDS